MGTLSEVCNDLNHAMNIIFVFIKAGGDCTTEENKNDSGHRFASTEVDSSIQFISNISIFVVLE